jgi:hypothetical protein
MSHVTYTPEPSSAVGSVPPAFEGEHLSTGVRKVLEAYAEREVQRVRWSAVFAGLFVSMGTQIMLGLLGVAIGITAVDPRAPNPLAGFGPSAGIWTAFTALLSLFVGGYAAAKLGGVIHRGDGVLSGTLTWATSLVLALWMALAGVSAAANIALQVPSAPAASAHIEQAVRARTPEAVRGAWFAFGGAALSLVAAMLGGAAGAVGKPRGHTAARRREEAQGS